MSLWLPSYRAFKRFIGELTAASAGVEVSVRHAVTAAAKESGPDPWRKLGHDVGVRLDGISSERVTNTASRLQLVSGYSGFDAFMRGLRSDWQHLSGSAWRRSEGDTPLEEVRRNAPPGTLHLGAEEFAIEHYRQCRNWIVHPSDSATEEANAFFKQKSAPLAEVREKWRRVGAGMAPSAPAELSFNDVKMFARVSLHVAETISGAFDPGDDALCRLIPIKNWSRLVHDTAGRRRAAAGYLQTAFGVDRERAERIATIAIAAN